MVGRDLSPDINLEDAMSYIDAVRDALEDAEPEKYEEFLRTFLDFGADRIGIVAFSASMQELLKDHVNLLLGFNVFLPLQFQINIPPTEFHKVVGRSVRPKPTMDDATSYLIAVKKAFHDEPAKYEEILKLLNDLKARRVDAASVIARVEELMKDHLNLLLGLCVFLSATRSFITKLKARFQGDASHVVDSVLEIMKMYSERNKSKDEAYQEIGALVQGHEDLVLELSEMFSDP